MGRTLVHVPNTSDKENGYAQIDHRTIQYIILRNVKYSLGSKSTLSTLAKPDIDAPKFDLRKLAVGNWFSEMQYYKLRTNHFGFSFECTTYNKFNTV